MKTINRPIFNSFVILIICIPAFLLTIPAISGATSASISASGNEGAITVSASGSFSSHEFCTGSGENKVCRTDSSGTLSVSHNTTGTHSFHAVCVAANKYLKLNNRE